MSGLDLTKAHQRYFAEICRIPHPSTKEKALSDYVLGVLKSKGISCSQDSLGNIIARLPATKGCEGAPSLILQAHMDMVCVKVPESTHDFDTDPIGVYVDEKGLIRARGTTLGADDGYGCAYLLAMTEADCPHPELELVFTVQEENGCYGIDALDCESLKSRRMIGLDVMGEDVEYVCCVSCFYSNHVELTKHCAPQPASGTAYELTVSGVKPVNGTLAPHCELNNAIKIAARLLNAAGDVRLSEWEGGEADNYYPVTCRAVIFTEHTDEIRREFESVRKELENRELKLEIKEITCGSALNIEDSRACIGLIRLMPNGVHTTTPDAKELTSVNNVGSVRLEGGTCRLIMSDRCKNKGYLKALEDEIRVLARLCGFEYASSLRYAPWEYKEDSPLRHATAQLMQEFYGHEMIESTCPGGLECCSMIPRMPGLDVVMFAPIGGQCHTPDEWLDMKSFDRVFEFLKELVARLAKE